MTNTMGPQGGRAVWKCMWARPELGLPFPVLDPCPWLPSMSIPAELCPGLICSPCPGHSLHQPQDIRNPSSHCQAEPDLMESRRANYFALCVEFAVYHFNQVYPDEYAYKLLWVRRSQRKPFTLIYLMELELGQTICSKQDEDLENCPLQEGPREKKVDCTFIVDVRPWISQFSLLNSTCVQK
uniref:Cystatin domain-containing protein n=1 Tax=Suricata suricatta TaxID=37032 RepID=A0A673TDY2_SURSU